MIEPEKITIVEGPPPSFEGSTEAWVPGLAEGQHLPRLAACRVRTFNGSALVERCHKAWAQGRPVHLDYRNADGLRQQAQILAVRAVESPDGDVLLLWVRLDTDEVEVRYDFGDDDFTDIDDDSELPPDASR